MGTCQWSTIIKSWNTRYRKYKCMSVADAFRNMASGDTCNSDIFVSWGTVLQIDLMGIDIARLEDAIATTILFAAPKSCCGHVLRPLYETDPT